MGDLIKLIKYTNCASWYRNIPTSIPIRLLSGEDDPVGNYGKGVKEVETKLKKRGINVTCNLYKNARHEILNDFTYETVRNDIFDFCNRGIL
jgi:alpha-beta hydrolase superfamily lysophospholipase